LLRGSPHARRYAGADPHGYRAEFIRLAEQAAELADHGPHHEQQ